ncbi:appendage-associated protein-like protein 3 (alp3) [Pyrolobus fumarii 1A]|uniref:Appendage-associated protein-like protein 3 (Alp3) n=1 Tax=Pyrolobus fumarii (strain DSM 11204 / 1A) TaxID=694429 RepID=G0EGJ4_PYRF1|nr:appendage-associated protein-like protein 3 (alp3) [Pyrolobus fumarii 1A]
MTIVSGAMVGGECVGPYRALASDVLDPGVVGLLARVARILADAGCRW